MLPSFRVDSAKSLNTTHLIHPDRRVLINRRANLGIIREKEKEHASDKIPKIGEFSFRGISQSTTHAATKVASGPEPRSLKEPCAPK